MFEVRNTSKIFSSVCQEGLPGDVIFYKSLVGGEVSGRSNRKIWSHPIWATGEPRCHTCAKTPSPLSPPEKECFVLASTSVTPVTKPYLTTVTDHAIMCLGNHA